MTPSTPLKLLILCPADSARGIMAEYLLRWKSRGRFVVCSAGVEPTGSIHPLTHWVLRERYGIDAVDARSKSWREFAGAEFDGVITIYDKCHEVLPVPLDAPILARWGCANPAKVSGAEAESRRAFLAAASQLSALAGLLCSVSVTAGQSRPRTGNQAVPTR